MRDIERIYKCSVNPINDKSIIKLIDIYSKSYDSDEYKDNLKNYSKKSSKKNTKYRDELYDLLNYDLGMNCPMDEEYENYINVRDNNEEKDFSIVLNTNYNSTMKLTKLFIKECIKSDLDFDVDFNIKGETDNSFMINCTGDKINVYIEILDKLREKFPNLFKDINEIGPLFSRINDKYGICSFSNGLDDFYEMRSTELFHSIDYSYMTYLSDHYNDNMLRKNEVVPIINILTYYVSDEVRDILLNSELNEEDFINKYGFKREILNDSDNFKFLGRLVKEQLINKFENNDNDDLVIRLNSSISSFVSIDKNNLNNIFREASLEIAKYKQELRDIILFNIHSICKFNDIDEDNYAFDKDSVFNNKIANNKKMF